MVKCMFLDGITCPRDNVIVRHNLNLKLNLTLTYNLAYVFFHHFKSAQDDLSSALRSEKLAYLF